MEEGMLCVLLLSSETLRLKKLARLDGVLVLWQQDHQDLLGDTVKAWQHNKGLRRQHFLASMSQKGSTRGGRAQQQQNVDKAFGSREQGLGNKTRIWLHEQRLGNRTRASQARGGRARQ